MAGVRPLLFICVLLSGAVTRQTTATSTTASTTPPLVTCITCQGIRCWSKPEITTCHSTHDLCMAHVTDHSDAMRDVTKGCATLTECQTKFLQSTVNTSACYDVDKHVTGTDLDCFFCCKGDNCNQGPQLVPPQGKLLVG